MKIIMRAILLTAVFGLCTLEFSPVSADMWVNENGNVGIGTATPKTLLEVSRVVDPSLGDTVLRISNSSNAHWQAGENACSIEFEKDSIVNAYIRSVHTRGGGDHSGQDAGLVFGTSKSPSPIKAVDRMIIDSDGNVGIGTLTPKSRLQIDGTDYPWLLMTGGNNGFLALRAYSNAPHHSNIFFDRRGDMVFASQPFEFRASGKGEQEVLRLRGDSGFVGIGTPTPSSALDVNGETTTNSLTVEGGAKMKSLDVGGTIKAEQLVLPDYGGGADFVFQEDYHLVPLEQVAAYVRLHKHLPGVPSAAQSAKKGLELTPTLTSHLQKIEELTLYMIQMKADNEELRRRISVLESRIITGADQTIAGAVP